MMDVSRSNRTYIGIFGPCNVGKSSLLNAMTDQDEAIVSDTAGTTTDVVRKNIEISGIGPCVLLDTAGFDDGSELGRQRIEKTRREAVRVDLALVLLPEVMPMCSEPDSQLDRLLLWKQQFERASVPVLFVQNKADLLADAEKQKACWSEKLQSPCLLVSARTRQGMDELFDHMAQLLSKKDEIEDLTGDLVKNGDLVLLVMPQDIQAPKGRLILPQVQTMRNLLDKHCTVTSCTLDGMSAALQRLSKAPDLIIVDSQVFLQALPLCPPESKLTSFSVLFARYKGDIPTFLEGASVLRTLRPDARVLIAESCTHTPKNEDIGRVKLPRLLRAKKGDSLQIDIVGGQDFPEDLSGYDLIIHCGACMFTRRHVLARMAAARAQGVAITNYGIAIAELNGMLAHVVYPS